LAHFNLSRTRWILLSGNRLAVGFVRLASIATFALLVLSPVDASCQGQNQRGMGIVRDQAATTNGNYYALVIGIDDYPPPLPRLHTAVADARAVSRVLNEHYGFQVQTLLDREATRAHILDAITRYRNTLSSNDSLLIYYAGHGYSDHEADKAYWLPVDADSSFSANRIIADDLTTGVRVLPARHVLVISDSCYSGGLTRDSDTPARSGGQEAFINRMQRSRSRTLMASGGDEPVSDAGTDGHSVFAYAVLRALERADGQVFTASDMFYGSVRRQVAGKSEQLPRYSVIRNSNDDEGDFVFSRKTGSAGTPLPRQTEMAATTDEAPAPNLPGPVPSTAPVDTSSQTAAATDIETYVNAMRLLDPNEVDAAAAKVSNAALAASLRAHAQSLRNASQPARPGAPQAYNPRSQLQLETAKVQAKNYTDGGNYMKALPIYQQLAEGGDSESMASLGYFYYNGWGVSQDYSQAAKWFEKAAGAGETSVMSALGLMYAMGKGVRQNDAVSVGWNRKAAAAGDATGMLGLAFMYENGRGVPKNMSTAIDWYRKSANAGDDTAKQNLRRLGVSP
jgi:Caspase domain/Sel1 repeat